eukprot:scaffold4013_cov140-Isochrysis_galbana.AAC.1
MHTSPALKLAADPLSRLGEVLAIQNRATENRGFLKLDIRARPQSPCTNNAVGGQMRGYPGARAA